MGNWFQALAFQMQLVPLLHHGRQARVEEARDATGEVEEGRGQVAGGQVRSAPGGGLHKLNPVVTHSLIAPGFNP
jgi:hypothetical protein